MKTKPNQQRAEPQDLGMPCPLLPPPGLDVEALSIKMALEIVGIAALHTETIPKAHRRILIWERLTERLWPAHLDRGALLQRHQGRQNNGPTLSDAAFKKKVLEQAWTLAVNDAARKCQ